MAKTSYTWRTKEGSILLIRDMETSHINNCINMLKEKIDEIKEEIFRGVICYVARKRISRWVRLLIFRVRDY